VIDHAVVMRRFADEALMSERLRRGQLSEPAIAHLALRLADFHAAAPVAALDGPFGQPAQARQSVLQVLAQLDAALPGDARLGALRAWCEARLQALEPELHRRLESGAVREGHGDLHLNNLIVPGDDSTATAFDGIEFDAALRWIDTMADIAFATMDLQAHGRRDLAFRFLDAYLQRGGDYAGTRVLRLFEGYRALVRALVVALSPSRTGAPDYLACAEALVAQGAAPRLLITCGPSGSGKSTVAAGLAAQAGAVRIRSDVERKRLFGLRALQRSAEQGLDLYTPEAGRRTFEHLAACARAALLGGYPVIVDAAFLSRATRQDFEHLAWQLGVPFTILACTADPETLRRRVAARDVAGTDPSEASVEVLEKQLETGEGLDAAEQGCALMVDTTEAVDVAALARRWLGLL
jgi:predicted kinase